MHLIITMIIFSLLSLTAFSEQGSWSTDDTAASQGDASLSGTDQKVQTMDEEVQLIEKEEFDPMEAPVVIEPPEQDDERGRYNEVDESTP